MFIIVIGMAFLIGKGESNVGSHCVSFELIRNSNLIFDDNNRLDLPNMTLSNSLEINNSCVETSDVELLAVLSDHVPCLSLSILFVNHSNELCDQRKRCDSLEVSQVSDQTTCLFKCPKRETSGGNYEVHLLFTTLDTTLNLCDLKVRYDKCSPNPCQHNGTCTDYILSHTCQCAPGYNGNNCENDNDDCNDVTCQNGGTCQDDVNSYNCLCVDGFAGDHCENNINPCESSPCEHGGTCGVDGDRYTCQCIVGSSGDKCQNNPDDCHSSPCQNGGTCVDGLNLFTCKCPSGKRGDLCQSNAGGGACPYSRNWAPPYYWPMGDRPDYYMPFEDNHCTHLLREARYEESGKIGRAVYTDGINDFVGLGDLTDITCLAIPAECNFGDIPGVTVLLWVKFNDCGGDDGIVSTHGATFTSGFALRCTATDLRFSVQKGDGNEFSVLFPAAYNTWTHVAMIYRGPDDGQGISVYKDGLHDGDHSHPTAVPNSGSDHSGTLMIGRLFEQPVPSDAKHAEAVVDELLIWNRQLSAEEIMEVNKME